MTSARVWGVALLCAGAMVAASSCGSRSVLGPDEMGGSNAGVGGSAFTGAGGFGAGTSSGGSITSTGGSNGPGGSAGFGAATGGAAGVSGSIGSGGVAGSVGAGGTTATGAGGMAGGPVGSGGFIGNGGAAGAATGGGAGVFLGSGGTAGTGTGGAAGAAGAPCPNALTPSEELIDNMNDGDPFIPSVNGRAGSWQSYHDQTPMASMFPDGLFVMTNSAEMCHGFAARATGGVYTIWGSGFSVGLGGPYNASAFRGVSFWARMLTGGPVIQVALTDITTDPAGGRCSTTPGAINSCYDHWTVPIMVAPTWTKFTVLFSSLRQGGWGNVAPTFRADAIFALQYNIGVGARFDVWVDDVALVR